MSYKYPKQPAPPGTGGNSAPAPPGHHSATMTASATPTSAYGYGGGYNYQQQAAAYQAYYGSYNQQPGSYPRPPGTGTGPGGAAYGGYGGQQQHQQQQQQQSPYAAYTQQQQQHYAQQQQEQQQQQQLAKQLQAFAKYDGRKRNLDDSAYGGGEGYYGSDAKRPRPDEWDRGGGRGGRGSFGHGGMMMARGGGGRGRGRGGYRPSFNESMEGCIPMQINFDNILTDKRFNFWNLPVKARVLLVSNLSMNVAQPQALFNFFSFYGDVCRVKILRARLNVALVEFSTATMAAITRDFTDGCVVSGKKIVVSFSKFDRVRLPEECNQADDGYTQDFTGPKYERLRRFGKADLMKANLKRVTKPTSCLHVANIPAHMSIADVRQHFEAQGGLKVSEVLAIEQSSRKGSKEEDKDGAGAATGTGTGTCTGKPGGSGGGYNRLMAYFEMSSVSDGATALALMSGACASSADDPSSGLKISFVATSLQEQRERIKKDSKGNLAIVDDNKKLG